MNSLTHTKWNCIYHIVFIPKYQQKVMYGDLKKNLQEIIRRLREYKNVKIVEGSMCVNHIHLCVKIPPKLSMSEFIGYLKGKITLMLFDKYPGRNEKQIREYIRNQEMYDIAKNKLQ